MPQRNSHARATVTRLALFAVVGWTLVALTRRNDAEEESVDAPVSPPAAAWEPQAERTAEGPRSRPRNRRQRIATSLAFTTLFFAGAAFSAGAGDMLVEVVEADCDAPVAELSAEARAACDAETTEAAGEPAGDDASTDEGSSESVDPAETGADTGTDPSDGGDADDGEPGEEPGTDESEPPADDGAGEAPADGGSNGGGEDAPADDKDKDDGSKETNEPAGEPILEVEDDVAEHDHELDPEASASGSVATVWLHRTFPDPTPVARRLTPAFAKQLAAVSKRTGVEWEAILAAIRADGNGGRRPADRAELRATAKQLRALLRGSDEWQAFLALRGRTAYADRATALLHYNRAVGLRALVTGLEAAKPALERKVLSDGRLDVYGAGRADVAAGRIDVRVLVLLRYLAERYEQVTVSSLDSGHGLYSRPGVVSAHKYGRAVDIAVLGGQAILGNSAPGGVTEHAVRDILLLPAELRPKQVISLLGLGGPSFPMGDHADHIHVGY